MTNIKTIDGLNDSLEQTIKNRSFQNLAIDFSETLTDSIIESEIIKDVPIVKTILNLGKLGSNTRDLFLIKKILTFLSQIDRKDDTNSKEFIAKSLERIAKDNTFFESLLNRLDRCDEIEKAKQIGLAFKHLLIEDITILEFKLIVKAINTINIDHLKYFILNNSRLKRTSSKRELWLKFMKAIDEDFFKSQLVQSGVFLNKSEVIKKGDKFIIENRYEMSIIGIYIIEMNDKSGYYMNSIKPVMVSLSDI